MERFNIQFCSANHLKGFFRQLGGTFGLKKELFKKDMDHDEVLRQLGRKKHLGPLFENGCFKLGFYSCKV